MGAVGKIFNAAFKVVLYACAFLGLFTAALLFVFASLIGNFETPPAPSLPDEFILTVDLDEEFTETPQEDIFTLVSGTAVHSLKDVTFALGYAANDPKVKSLTGRITSSRIGTAEAQEIIAKVQDFNNSGKNSVLYSETIGLDGFGTLDYYLASSFKEIWLQPTGSVNITGLFMEVPFLHSLLAKIGVSTDFYARYEYKGGAEYLASENMSPFVRQNMECMADNIYQQIISGIAKARNIPEAQVKNRINSAPLSATKALKAGLADKLAYFDELEEQTKDMPKVAIGDYIAYLKALEIPKKNKIALIYLEGMIISGSSGYPSFGDGNSFAGAEDIIEALQSAASDKDVKAIVIRINSPGGSYTASDAIWHAIETIKEKHKIPVIASLGNTAASGGYFAALGADKIIALPASITGSIGVFGGKIVLKGLWEKLGVNWDYIQKGTNADMMSLNKPFSEAQVKAFGESLDEVYTDFTQKTAKARNLSWEQTDKAARGRVWTGEQALKIGLVDEIGGLGTAFNKAKEMSKIEEYSVQVYPSPKTPFELLGDFLESKNILADFFYRLSIIGADSHLFSPFPALR